MLIVKEQRLLYCSSIYLIFFTLPHNRMRTLKSKAILFIIIDVNNYVHIFLLFFQHMHYKDLCFTLYNNKYPPKTISGTV